MKLALVYPRFKYQSGAPPIGLLQIAASIRQQNKASLDFIDTTYEQDISTFRERVRIGAYNLVGL